MTKEEKQLLLKDLCGRLPYGVKGINTYNAMSSPGTWETEFNLKYAIIYRIEKFGWRPYLFPLSSMTEEQKQSSPIGYDALETFIENKDWSIIELSIHNVIPFF